MLEIDCWDQGRGRGPRGVCGGGDGQTTPATYEKGVPETVNNAQNQIDRSRTERRQLDEEEEE